MIMARENRGQFKDLDFSDVEIIDAEKVDSWK
jgi:hypothetical protein